MGPSTASRPACLPSARWSSWRSGSASKQTSTGGSISPCRSACQEARWQRQSHAPRPSSRCRCSDVATYPRAGSSTVAWPPPSAIPRSRGPGQDDHRLHRPGGLPPPLRDPHSGPGHGDAGGPRGERGLPGSRPADGGAPGRAHHGTWTQVTGTQAGPAASGDGARPDTSSENPGAAVPERADSIDGDLA